MLCVKTDCSQMSNLDGIIKLFTHKDVFVYTNVAKVLGSHTARFRHLAVCKAGELHKCVVRTESQIIPTYIMNMDIRRQRSCFVWTIIATNFHLVFGGR